MHLQLASSVLPHTFGSVGGPSSASSCLMLLRRDHVHHVQGFGASNNTTPLVARSERAPHSAQKGLQFTDRQLQEVVRSFR